MSVIDNKPNFKDEIFLNREFFKVIRVTKIGKGSICIKI